jgi:hypothetical protein
MGTGKSGKMFCRTDGWNGVPYCDFLTYFVCFWDIPCHGEQNGEVPKVLWPKPVALAKKEFGSVLCSPSASKIPFHSIFLHLFGVGECSIF